MKMLPRFSKVHMVFSGGDELVFLDRSKIQDKYSTCLGMRDEYGYNNIYFPVYIL